MSKFAPLLRSSALAAFVLVSAPALADDCGCDNGGGWTPPPTQPNPPASSTTTNAPVANGGSATANGGNPTAIANGGSPTANANGTGVGIASTGPVTANPTATASTGPVTANPTATAKTGPVTANPTATATTGPVSAQGGRGGNASNNTTVVANPTAKGGNASNKTNVTANPTAIAAGGKAQQAQKQGQQQSVDSRNTNTLSSSAALNNRTSVRTGANTAAGGAGGQGGAGGIGVGGTGLGGTGTGGTSAATGGAVSGVAGGSNSGTSSSSNGPITFNTKYQAAAYAPNNYVMPSGQCGEAISASFGVVAATGGAGYGWPSMSCMRMVTYAQKYSDALQSGQIATAAAFLHDLGELDSQFADSLEHAIQRVIQPGCIAAGQFDAAFLATQNNYCAQFNAARESARVSVLPILSVNVPAEAPAAVAPVVHVHPAHAPKPVAHVAAPLPALANPNQCKPGCAP